MLDADRSPNMQSAFLPELHRWISKLTARHLHACPPGDLLITMVKETVILYKKEIRKMKKKSRISPWCERDENAKWLRDCLWLCQRANVVLHVGLCEEIFARKHTATHKPTSAQPLSAPHSDQRDIHTRINRLWSPLAYGLGGNNRLWSPLAYGLGGNNYHDDTHTHTYTYKIASRCSPQASYDRRRHRSCFPTRPAQAFPKK